MEKVSDDKIVVLVSTYNGEAYLRCQLDSLIHQTRKAEILIRDDGSSDSTRIILKEYANKYPNIRWYTGKNLKPAHSFYDLIMNVSKAYDYYFFCDQDDVWLNDKLEIAVDRLKDYKFTPAMYYSATKLVDSKLNIIGENFRNPNYSRSLICSFLHGSLITGCTICINKELLMKLKQYTPVSMSMHDAWIHRLCLSIGGEIIADSTPHILYRQHSSNVLGLHKRKKNDILKSFFSSCPIHLNMALQILNNYGGSADFPSENKCFLNDFVCYKKNICSYIRFLCKIIFAHIDIKTKIIIILKILMKRY